MAKPRFPWPFSFLSTIYTFEDGSKMWPSGIEQFSYVDAMQRRINVLVACEASAEGRRYFVYTDTIDKYVSGEPVAPEVHARVVAAFEDYFRTRKKLFSIERSG